MNDQVTLSTGRVIPLSDVRMEPDSQRFYYGVADVTAFLSAAQKRRFPGYDVERANREASDAARIRNGLDPYDDPPVATFYTVLEDTAAGIGADVATAAKGVRDFAGIGPENAGKRSPIFWTLLIAGLGFLAYQLGVFAWVRKKLSA